MPDIIRIEPCDMSELSSGKFKKVDLSSDQKAQLSFALSQMPEFTAANAASKLYYVKYPEGVTGSLMQLKTGGVGSAIMGERGIVAQAGFHNLASVAAPVQLFSLMALATGQHYLSVINNEIEIINQKMDKILGFLYGNKRAELMAEISFVQYAYDNYSSIMKFDQQRVATIANLQSAKKIAMKDIEFYLNELETDSNANDKEFSEFTVTVEKALKNQKSLEYAMQLFAMSGIMEAYYSQNLDENYLNYLRSNMTLYIEKCNHQVTSAFNTLVGKNRVFDAQRDKKIKLPLQKKSDTKPLEQKIQQVLVTVAPDKSEMRDTIYKALDALTSEHEYCISAEGDLFISA